MNLSKILIWAACFLCCGAVAAVLSGCSTTSATTQTAVAEKAPPTGANVEKTMTQSKESAFCNLKAMSAEERTRYNEVKAKINASKSGVSELPNGYSFSLKADKDMIREVGEFLSYEKSCCPFFEFAVNIKEETLTLAITGPEDAKDIIKGAFNL
ncbi:MAG TPA: hypothetical protein PLK77_17815 [Pyrinomonadaceae bacterium]|nr:hypothetical protein [Pyrinomonadaceae bacterium]